ncbi:MAG: RNA polymerase sigma factor [bacterium]|nr:RNA polymerase sigma factor [bacterium]
MALADVPVALIEACRRGERAAIERLLRLVSPDIYRLVYSMLRDHDDADEVVQETLIRLFRHLPSLKDADRFASWVMRIAVNQVQTWRVKKGRNRLYEMAEGFEPDEDVIVFAGSAGGNPREEAVRREVRDEIELAMTELPERQKMAMVLFEIEGLSIKEVASAMDCSEGAVKFNIHKARKKLQRRLAHLVKNWKFGSRSAAAAPDCLANVDHP